MSAPHSASTHPAAHTHPPALRFAHRRVSLILRTNDTTVAEFARRQFAAVLDAKNSIYDHHAFIRAASGRIEVTFDGERLFEALIPDSAESKAIAAFYAVRDCFTHAISCGNECVIYGTSLSIAGAGVLLLGPPGSGKTLTAIHLGALGAKVLGDDVAVLTADGILDAVPRTLSLRADHAASMPALSLGALRRTLPALGSGDLAMYCLRPEECGISQASEPAPLRSLVFLDQAQLPGVHLLQPRVAEAWFARYRQRGKRGAMQRPAPLGGLRSYRADAQNPAQLAERLARMLQCA